MRPRTENRRAPTTRFGCNSATSCRCTPPTPIWSREPWARRECRCTGGSNATESTRAPTVAETCLEEVFCSVVIALSGELSVHLAAVRRVRGGADVGGARSRRDRARAAHSPLARGAVLPGRHRSRHGLAHGGRVPSRPGVYAQA